MKKTIYSTLILLLLLTCIIVPTTAQESNPTYVVAQLAKPNDISEIDFSKFLEPRFEAGWTVFDHNHAIDFQYYDDLSGMLMALNAGTVDEITLPRFVAEYVVKTNPELAKFSTADILAELIYRDKNGDNSFHLMSESVTSYTFKFWKFH